MRGSLVLAAFATFGIAGESSSPCSLPLPLARVGELRFDANAGQWADGSRFHAIGRGGTAALDERGIHLGGSVTIRVHDGAAIVPDGDDRLATSVTRIAADGAHDVPTFRRVVYRGVRPGVDLVVHADAGGALEYDVVLEPGVDPASVELDIEGGDSTLTADGDLVVGTVVQRAPRTYQIRADGTRAELASRYVQRGPYRYAFEVPSFDPERRLVVDPVLVSSTYLGGAGYDSPRFAGADASGNFYLSGYNGATDDTTPSAVHVTKLDPLARTVLWVTYMPAPPSAMAVSRTGQVILCGRTDSSAYPTKNAVQPTYSGEYDIFLSALTADGADLDYSTYLGGPNGDSCEGLTVDAAGAPYVLGETPGVPAPYTGRVTAIKLTPDGRHFAYVTNTPLSSAGIYPQPVAVDGHGRLVGAQSLIARVPFATTPGALQTRHAGFADIALARLTPDGGVDFATYLGGNGSEQPRAIAIDADDAIVLTGYTTSTSFPLVAAAQRLPGGVGDAFVAKIAASGDRLVFSTYLGGSAPETPSGLAVDASGNVIVAGSTSSTTFPLLDPIQDRLRGRSDAYVAVYDPAGRILASTLLGGTGDESDVVLAASGNHALVAGSTFSTDFPLVEPMKLTPDGISDAFVSVIRTPDGGAAHPADAGAPVDDAGEPGDNDASAAATDAGAPSPGTADDAGGGNGTPHSASSSPTGSARGCAASGHAPSPDGAALLALVVLIVRRRRYRPSSAIVTRSSA